MKKDLLRLRFLGGISIGQDGLEYSSQLPGKALAMVCYLAMTGEEQSRGLLSSLLWSDFPERRARSNLRDTLTVLRRSPLAPYLVIGRRSVSLNGDLAFWLDTAEFQAGVEHGIKELANGPTGLEDAIALYRGDFLAGFQIPKASLFDEWATMQCQELHLTAVDSLQRLVECHIDAGSYQVGIPYAAQLLRLDPWREETHRNLMLMHMLNGDHLAALQQYEECRQLLAAELDVEPARETQILYQNIRKKMGRQSVVGTTGHLPDVSLPAGPVPHNLPSMATPFVGREVEQRAIENALQDKTGRLVTIFGVGGIGKTRLALAIGEKQIRAIERDGSHRFPDGVYFVPLESVESPEAIVPALCRALRFQPADESRVGQTAEQQLVRHLRHKRLLLIIDNFEQLIARTGLLARIRQSTTGVHLLVTSREKLRLHGERLYALEGLHYPEIALSLMNSERTADDYSALALFASSARRVKSDFQIHEEDLAPLVQLCHLVDGLPLAVELAAGWTNVLSVRDITAEIEQGLGFLESDLRDLPRRHRSMAAVFDVSWQRLAGHERELFARLSIFRGGFTRQAAGHVVEASLRQLASLVNKGLIQYDRTLDRYQMHRLLRQFGVEKLSLDPAASQALGERHHAYFIQRLLQWGRQLKGAGQRDALARFERESANVRAAWHFAAGNCLTASLDQAAGGLYRLYLWRRRYQEGEMACRMAEESVARAIKTEESGCELGQLTRILAKTRLWQSVFCQHAQADRLVWQALDMLRDPNLAPVDTRREKAFAYRRCGDLCFNDEGGEAKRMYSRSLALCQELGDRWGVAKALTALGWLAAHAGDGERALGCGQEALAICQENQDRKQTADVLWLLGTLAISSGQIDKATRQLGESLDIRKTMGDRITDIASGPMDLGMTLTWIGRMEEAAEIREETLAHFQAQGQPEEIAIAHVRLSTSSMHTGDFEKMEHHARIGLKQCRKLGLDRGCGLALWILAWSLWLKGEHEQATQLLRQSVTIFSAIEGAQELGWVFGLLADIERRQGQIVEAKRHVFKALQETSGILGFITILITLWSYFNLLVDEGQMELAAEIEGALSLYPLLENSASGQRIYRTNRHKLRQVMAPEHLEAALERGRAVALTALAAQIKAALAKEVG